MTIKHQRLMAYASCVLLLLQVITVLVSWVWGSVILDTNVSSLLTADGVRWFCSSLVDNVRSPLLIYILLIGLTAGQVRRSKILADLASFSTLPSFQRKAMTVALWEIAAILVVVAYLTLAPHAVLLSALGTLFPSSFSAFLVPLLCTMAGVASIRTVEKSGAVPPGIYNPTRSIGNCFCQHTTPGAVSTLQADISWAL